MSAQLMRKALKKVTELIPGYCITLLVWEFNKPGLANYVSNGDRSDMIKALRETADRLEKNQTFDTPEEN